MPLRLTPLRPRRKLRRNVAAFMHGEAYRPENERDRWVELILMDPDSRAALQAAMAAPEEQTEATLHARLGYFNINFLFEDGA